MAQILPSIFGADILHLQEDIDFLEEEKTQILHVDLMDGNFVSNIAWPESNCRNEKAFKNGF